MPDAAGLSTGDTTRDTPTVNTRPEEATVPGGRQGTPGFDPRRLRAAREAAHLTQGALAEAAGVHFKEVREWESGRRVPQVGAVAALADALHLRSALDLLDHDADHALTLQRLRTAAGISQESAAHAAGLRRTTYSQIERGETGTLSAEDASAIAAALGVDAVEVRAAHAASRAAQLERRASRRNRPHTED
jgi:transcriptional regulator with XRE-family HTH domain